MPHLCIYTIKDFATVSTDAMPYMGYCPEYWTAISKRTCCHTSKNVYSV